VNTLQLGSGEDASLEFVQRDWSRNRIMLPTKKFSGPVGIFQRLSRRLNINGYRSNAICQARFKAYKSFHFGGHESLPIRCPAPCCDVICTVEGEWTVHANSTAHDEFDTYHEYLAVAELYEQPSFYLCSTVPDEIEIPPLEMENKWRRQTLDSKAEWNKFRWQCGQAGTDRRRAFEEAFLNQVKHDPLYQHHGPARECSIWEDLLEDIPNPMDYVEY